MENPGGSHEDGRVARRAARTPGRRLLRELHTITGRGTFLFPSLQTKLRPISENSVNVALRRLGYTRDEMTGHGFRVMASTLLNEKGCHPDVIELQLAHAERNKVRAAYNRAQRLVERRTMMQAWADYLDELTACGGAVAGSSAQRRWRAQWPLKCPPMATPIEFRDTGQQGALRAEKWPPDSAR
jgi:hypothetical protein